MSHSKTQSSTFYCELVVNNKFISINKMVIPCLLLYHIIYCIHSIYFISILHHKSKVTLWCSGGEIYQMPQKRTRRSYWMSSILTHFTFLYSLLFTPPLSPAPPSLSFLSWPLQNRERRCFRRPSGSRQIETLVAWTSDAFIKRIHASADWVSNSHD